MVTHMIMIRSSIGLFCYWITRKRTEMSKRRKSNPWGETWTMRRQRQLPWSSRRCGRFPSETRKANGELYLNKNIPVCCRELKVLKILAVLHYVSLWCEMIHFSASEHARDSIERTLLGLPGLVFSARISLYVHDREKEGERKRESEAQLLSR